MISKLFDWANSQHGQMAIFISIIATLALFLIVGEFKERKEKKQGWED